GRDRRRQRVEFLGIGYQELLLVLVLLLVVVGPERLPQMAYQIGRAVREMQKYARAVRDEFSEELGYIEEQYQTIRGDIDEARTEMRKQSQELNQEIKQVTSDVDGAIPNEFKSRGNVIPISAG